MAIKNVEMNVKTDVGLDQLYPKSVADIVGYNNTVSGLTSTNVQGGIDEIISSKANPNGIATLNNTGNVPDTQLGKAQPNGVASLDNTGNVPDTQLGNIKIFGSWIDLGDKILSQQRSTTILIPNGISEVRIISNNMVCSSQVGISISFNNTGATNEYSIGKTDYYSGKSDIVPGNNIINIRFGVPYSSEFNITGLLNSDYTVCNFMCGCKVWAVSGCLFYTRAETVSSIQIFFNQETSCTFHVWGR